MDNDFTLQDPLGRFDSLDRTDPLGELDQLGWDILSYLLDHPEAEDSVEGIAEWWVLERAIRRRTNEVGRALDDLVDRGLITARQDSRSNVRYRLKVDQLADLQSKFSLGWLRSEMGEMGEVS